MAKIQIDNRDFVVTYMRADSREDLCKAMNLTAQQVQSKINYLKKKGVNLPKLQTRSFSTLEVAQLNSLIKKMQREKEGK